MLKNIYLVMEALHCLVTTPSLCIFYDTANQWLYNQWLGMHDQESVRRGAELISLHQDAQRP
jgi:hypothetical protein